MIVDRWSDDWWKDRWLASRNDVALCVINRVIYMGDFV